MREIGKFVLEKEGWMAVKRRGEDEGVERECNKKERGETEEVRGREEGEKREVMAGLQGEYGEREGK